MDLYTGLETFAIIHEKQSEVRLFCEVHAEAAHFT